MAHRLLRRSTEQLSWSFRPSVAGGAKAWLRAVPYFIALCFLIGCDSTRRRPNVVLITIDTLRADALGIYGNTEGLTVHIDALAREAVVFADTVTPIGTTFPSHASMFTGLYPKRHEVRWNGDALEDKVATLAEILSTQGYETSAFVSFTTMLSRGGLHQGFAVLSDSPSQDQFLLARDGDDVNKLAKDWLSRRTHKPFFMWVHYSEPHSPYRATRYAQQFFSESGYSGDLAAGLTTEKFLSMGNRSNWSPVERSALRALYDGEVREVDRLVGELVADLKRRDLLGETIIVLASDHGQALGEHGDVAHGFLLWQPVIQVPLVIRLPGGGTSKRIATRVSLIDVTPTILDLLGLPVPAVLDGRSLLPALSGESLLPQHYFAEVRALGNDQIHTVADSDRFAVFDGDIKATWDAGTLRIVNLKVDPQEIADGEVGKAQRQTLLDLLQAYREGGPDGHIGHLPQGVEEELRSLGYIR